MIDCINATSVDNNKSILFWTICHLKSYLSQFYFGRFTTSHICHNFILDDLSQVISVLDDMSQKRNSDLWRYVGAYGRFVMSFREVTFGMHAC